MLEQQYAAQENVLPPLRTAVAEYERVLEVSIFENATSNPPLC